jgi:hypothetical protein
MCPIFLGLILDSLTAEARVNSRKAF